MSSLVTLGVWASEDELKTRLERVGLEVSLDPRDEISLWAVEDVPWPGDKIELDGGSAEEVRRLSVWL